MGVFDDYIKSLDGKDNIDPLEVVSELHNLYKQEIDPALAKINEQKTAIDNKDQEIAKANAEVQTFKAKNFDLMMQLPGSDPKHRNENEAPDGANIRVSDLFKTDVRKNNPLLRGN